MTAINFFRQGTEVSATVALLCAVPAMIGFASGAVLHVPAQYDAIQEAIGHAVHGDTVLVQPGTYVESLDFDGKAITVTGVAPEDSSVVGRTVVDARASDADPRSVVTFKSGEGSASVLAGLTLTGGTGTPWRAGRLWGEKSCAGGGVFIQEASPSLYRVLIRDNQTSGEEGWGGGILCVGASPLLQECTIRSNEIREDPEYWNSMGAGVASMEGSAPRLVDCVLAGNKCGRGSDGGGIAVYRAQATLVGTRITGNSAESAGGGIHVGMLGNIDAKDCLIDGNEAGFGGGVSSETWFFPAQGNFTDCRIVANGAYAGGGINLVGQGSFEFQNCSVVGNRGSRIGPGAPGCAGGVYQLVDKLRFVNCVIAKNYTDGEGGGVWSFGRNTSEYVNCIVAGNQAEKEGGGFYLSEGDVRMIHCTVVDNRSSQGGGLFMDDSGPEITNTIFWEDGTSPVVGVGASFPVITYSAVAGGWPGEGNIDLDPGFVRYGGASYVLRPSSPCIDAGAGAHDGIDWCSLHPGYCQWNSAAPDMGAFGGPDSQGWLP